MKYLSIFSLFLLCGCVTPIIGAFHCLDAKIERKPRVIESPIRLWFKIEGEERVEFEYNCEAYYSAQCSVRGNSWKVRQISGSIGPPRKEYVINGATVVIRAPKCSVLYADSREDFEWFRISINDKPVYAMGHENNIYRFKEAPTNSPDSTEYRLRFSYEFELPKID